MKKASDLPVASFRLRRKKRGTRGKVQPELHLLRYRRAGVVNKHSASGFSERVEKSGNFPTEKPWRCWATSLSTSLDFELPGNAAAASRGAGRKDGDG